MYPRYCVHILLHGKALQSEIRAKESWPCLVNDSLLFSSPITSSTTSMFKGKKESKVKLTIIEKRACDTASKVVRLETTFGGGSNLASAIFRL